MKKIIVSTALAISACRLLGAEPFSMKPDEVDSFIAAATESTGSIVKAANIKPR